MNKIMKRMKNRKGFTLIELIVVIAIIAILAAVLIPRFTGFTDSAREKSALSDARNILLALEALDASGEFPDNANDFKDEVNKYTGKEIIKHTSEPAPKAEGDTWFTANPASLTNGITFTFNKCDNGKIYTVPCEESKFKDITSVAAA